MTRKLDGVVPAGGWQAWALGVAVEGAGRLGPPAVVPADFWLYRQVGYCLGP